jgi:hypothetical protein
MTKTPTLDVGPDNVQTLHAGEHRAWRSRRPVRLHVQRGRVWVTSSNSLDDHFVDAGMSLVLPADADVLVGAESDTRVRLDDAVRAAPAARAAWTTMAACPTR